MPTILTQQNATAYQKLIAHLPPKPAFVFPDLLKGTRCQKFDSHKWPTVLVDQIK